MDWCVDVEVGGATPATVDQVCAYLDRHTTTPAGGPVRTLVADTLAAAEPAGPLLWVRVDWDRESPELVIRSLATAGWPERQLEGPDFRAVAPGVAVANSVAVELAAAANITAGVALRRELPARRDPEPDLDASPALLRTDPGELSREAFLTAVALTASGADTGLSPEARAAQAGAELSVAALGAYLRRTGRSGPRNAAEAAAAFLELQHAAGGEFYLLEADEDHAVLGNTRCPFGSGVTAAPMMCRCTSAVLGHLGAQAGGEAWVTMPDRIALGDPECRAVLHLGGDRPSPISHRYTDPPAGLDDTQGPVAAGRLDGDPRIVLSLLLPRDAGSVPVVRHMCEQVVGALGASADAIGDLTVALTEACSNVIRHAQQGDDFQVDVELGAERCELVVSYRDDGFDPLSVGVAVGDQLSESGRGLLLMRALVDELDFNFDPGHTRVRMTKQLDFEGESSIRTALQGRPIPPSGAA